MRAAVNGAKFIGGVIELALVEEIDAVGEALFVARVLAVDLVLVDLAVLRGFAVAKTGVLLGEGAEQLRRIFNAIGIGRGLGRGKIIVLLRGERRQGEQRGGSRGQKNPQNVESHSQSFSRRGRATRVTATATAKSYPHPPVETPPYRSREHRWWQISSAYRPGRSGRSQRWCIRQEQQPPAAAFDCLSNPPPCHRSEEHTSELQSHSFISYAVFCLKK